MQVSPTIKESVTPEELAEIEEFRSYFILWGLFVIALVIFGLTFFLKEDLRRLNYDAEKRKNLDDEYQK